MDCTLYKPGIDAEIYGYTEHDCYYQHYYTINDKPISLYDEAGRVFIAMLIFMASLAFSSWFSGRYLIEEVVEEKKEKPKKTYIDKYTLPTEKEMIEKLSINNNVSKNVSVMEKTPMGTVIIRYNQEREGFEYWCDDKNVKFDFLETVARKFVMMNFCVQLYHDRHKDIKEQKEEFEKISMEEAQAEEAKEAKETKEETKQSSEKKTDENVLEEQIEEELKTSDDTENDDSDSDDDVFVKSKTLLQKAKPEIGNAKNEEAAKPNEIVARKANKYFYIGKVKEYQWCEKPKVALKAKKMSYSDWFKSKTH